MGNKRKTLSLADRVQVIEESRKNVPQRVLAERFGCGKTQIQAILKEQAAILLEWTSFNGEVPRQKKRRLTYEVVDEKLIEWFSEARAKRIPLSGPIIQEKAMQIAEEYGAVEFKASNGWIESFRKRHGIIFRAISGESGDVDDQIVREFQDRLPLATEGYDPKNIFNVDETGLFFRALPDRSLVQKQEECRGGKMAKDRLTVALCASSTGEKLPALVIYKSRKPRCFKNVNVNNLGIQWAWNAKAWMTSDIFRDWVNRFNDKMRSQGRKILLVLDNAPCHPKLSLSNIELLFLPPNTSCKSQPLDQGIIQAMKLRYRKMMLRYLVSQMDSASRASDLCKQLTVLDACRWIREAWNDVNHSTIVGCFQRCGFNNTTESISASENDQSTLENVRDLATQAGVTEFRYEEDVEHSCAQLDCTEAVEQMDNEAIEEEESIIEPIAVSECMRTLASYKALITRLADDGENCKAMDDLKTFERSLQDLILVTRQKKSVQTTLDAFVQRVL